MHQTIELLLKAHVARIDPSFLPKPYGHRSTELINDYAPRVPVFSRLAVDPQVMDPIANLAAAWDSLRYGEATFHYSAEGYNKVRDAGFELVNE